ncbi:hypothetical protein KV396_00555 [Microbacterium galbinum]|uniref:Peptidoglycan binding-like domain-containing protein n=1 Tax=Microbacterium galbinum TaxID=2851646 RepID=A0ABY4IVW8_9MICO|nr:hypothetical protein KV396_00555 [Microbacterium galbinum]
MSGWGRVLRGNRTLWIVAASAVVCLVAGLLVGRFVLTPEDASADAPDPGLVTAPVEFGELTNDVTLRADVGYADAVDVKIDTSGLSGGAAVVTMAPPAVGTVLNPLSVALEVADRPVIVLPGELPAYRTMKFGASGQDVLQLKQALAGLGFGVGDVKSNLYDQATAEAVGALYAKAGYPVPESEEEGAEDAVAEAEKAVRTANDGVTSAEEALAEAGAGPGRSELLDLDVNVAAAEAGLAEAKKTGEGVQQAEWDLQKARVAREEALAPKNTSAEQAALASAKEDVTAAEKDLEEARQNALPFLPASEVLFLTELPRRVDEVKVKRGAVLTDAAMTISGATIRLTGAAAEADGALIKKGSEATFELTGGDGTEFHAVIAAVAKGEGESSRWTVILEPDPLKPEQIEALKGQNVRVKVPVGKTEGEVLSVPLAAVTAGPGGESRVEVVDSDPREGDEAKTHVVVVETGLAAKGAVEVTPVEGELDKGDLVVIGE